MRISMGTLCVVHVVRRWKVRVGHGDKLLGVDVHFGGRFWELGGFSGLGHWDVVRWYLSKDFGNRDHFNGNRYGHGRQNRFLTCLSKLCALCRFNLLAQRRGHICMLTARWYPRCGSVTQHGTIFVLLVHTVCACILEAALFVHVAVA